MIDQKHLEHKQVPGKHDIEIWVPPKNIHLEKNKKN